MNQESSRAVGEKSLDSVFISKAKQTPFADALNVGYKRKQGIRDDCTTSVLRS